MIEPNRAPKLTVVVLAYNHENFIGQALDSIVAQQTDFAVEAIVTDDCSTDDTRAVIEDYHKNHPGLIRPLYNLRNLGPRRSLENALLAARGNYVALLDGDDYWTDPNKLQAQVDQLDADADMTLSFHPSLYLVIGDEAPLLETDTRDFGYDLADLMKYNPVHSQTMVFRRSLFTGFPGWMHDDPSLPGDYYLVLLAAKNGQVGFINQPMSVYRIHPQGVWSSLNFIERLGVEIHMNAHLKRWFGPRFWPLLTSINLGLRFERLKTRFISTLRNHLPKSLLRRAIRWKKPRHV